MKTTAALALTLAVAGLAAACDKNEPATTTRPAPQGAAAAPVPEPSPPPPVAPAAPAAEADPIQSNDILARAPVTDNAEVKHILISWNALGGVYHGRQDPRGAARTKADADKLALDLLKQVRSGAPIEPLMKQWSEDPGSAASGTPYPVTPNAGLVPPFKELSLRLKVGEAGLVQTMFGWHIIKRTK